ncbi:MAG: hypothetical protein JST58_06300 [Bacteroidetes bacterium]|nr:hypothetical protein [Bacteroidota bacterium]
MVIDSIFYSQNKPIKKIALLLTIPCAIVPIMMATAGIMSIPFSPIFFRYDFILFGILYLWYAFGLLLSWRVHRHWIPISFFLCHVGLLFSFDYFKQSDWIAYATIASIIATSLSNQYFRLGSFECTECNYCPPRK